MKMFATPLSECDACIMWLYHSISSQSKLATCIIDLPFPSWTGYMCYHHIHARSLLHVVITSYPFSHRIGFSVYCLPPQRWAHTHRGIWRFYVRPSWIGYRILQWDICVTALSFSRDTETLCLSNSPMGLICIIVLPHVTLKYYTVLKINKFNWNCYSLMGKFIKSYNQNINTYWSLERYDHKCNACISSQKYHKWRTLLAID
jgi:hypothetical protein